MSILAGNFLGLSSGSAKTVQSRLWKPSKPIVHAMCAYVIWNEVLWKKWGRKRARPKRDRSAPVRGIGREAPVAASPSSAPVDSPNTRTKPDGDDLGSAPVGGIDGEVPVAGSPTSAPAVSPDTRTKPDGDGLDIPEYLNRRDPAERTFAGLKAEWQNAEPFRHAWANAPAAVRDKFYAEVMQDYRE